jgi:hypothetical protein
MAALPKRHRKIYNPVHPAPYELSRSRIENFVKCSACFYLKQVKGINFPSIPQFNLNIATDILLKRDFDRHRGKDTTHPYLVNIGYDYLVPFEHPNLELWTQSMHFGAEGHFHTVHAETNLKIGGGIDDVWLNTKNKKLHVVDFKSTSSSYDTPEISLGGKWKAAYKRQMDLYVWILMKMEFDVDTVGFFLYVDGDRFTQDDFLTNDQANMKFKVTFIPYEANTSWIEPTLYAIKDLLTTSECPKHHETCEYGVFLDAIG